MVPVAEVNELAESSAQAGRPVVVAAPFMYDAAVHDGLSGMRADVGDLSLVESVVTVPAEGTDQGSEAPLYLGLLAQVGAIRLTVQLLRDVVIHFENAQAYMATSLVGNTTVLLAGLLSTLRAPVLCLDLVALRDCWSIRLDETTIATPAQFVSRSGSGLRRPCESYESGLRAAWQNLHAAVTRNEQVRYGLKDLVGDMDLVARGLDRHE